MQSFAFWYEKSDKENTQTLDNVSAKLNFNIWTECWDDKTTYLDIGFMVNNIKSVSKLFMFVPLKIEDRNIKDLGCTLVDPILAGAIFNENLQVQSTSDKTFTIKNKDTNDSFYVYKLDMNNATPDDRDIQVTSCDDGTILSINVEHNPSLNSIDAPVYFRFRIYGVDFSKIIHEYTVSKKGFQSIFNIIYTLDFRYMNKRCLTGTFLEKMNSKKNRKMKINSIHFLLITKTHVDVKGECSSSRKLEDKVWNSYVNIPEAINRKKNKGTDDLIAYHYKYKNENSDNGDSKEVDSAEVFIKYTVEKSILWVYIITTLILGVVGSCIATLIQFLIKWCQH